MKNLNVYAMCVLSMATMCFARNHRSHSHAGRGLGGSLHDVGRSLSRDLITQGADMGAKVHNIVNNNLHRLKGSLPLSVYDGQEHMKHLSRKIYRHLRAEKRHQSTHNILLK